MFSALCGPFRAQRDRSTLNGSAPSMRTSKSSPLMNAWASDDSRPKVSNRKEPAVTVDGTGIITIDNGYVIRPLMSKDGEFGIAVGLEAGVTVQMILGDVEHYADLGRNVERYRAGSCSLPTPAARPADPSITTDSVASRCCRRQRCFYRRLAEFHREGRWWWSCRWYQ